MKKNKESMFVERIAIKGIGTPVCFTFRELHGEEGMTYKIRAVSPEADFNMHNGIDRSAIKFEFSDLSSLPAWLTKDKEAHAKLSRAIKFSANR